MMPGTRSVQPRSGKQLIEATRPYVDESRLRSWWCVGSTLMLLISELAGAAILPWLSVRIVASLVGAQYSPESWREATEEVIARAKARANPTVLVLQHEWGEAVHSDRIK